MFALLLSLLAVGCTERPLEPGDDPPDPTDEQLLASLADMLVSEDCLPDDELASVSTQVVYINFAMVAKHSLEAPMAWHTFRRGRAPQAERAGRLLQWRSMSGSNLDPYRPPRARLGDRAENADIENERKLRLGLRLLLLTAVTSLLREVGQMVLLFLLALNGAARGGSGVDEGSVLRGIQIAGGAVS